MPDQTDVQRASPAALAFHYPSEEEIVLTFSGGWVLGTTLPDIAQAAQAISDHPQVRKLRCEASNLQRWDSGLLTFLSALTDLAASRSLSVEHGSLPEGVQRLLRLATAIPERAGVRRTAKRPPFVERVGGAAIAVGKEAYVMADFVGDAILSLIRLVRGKARFRRVDLFQVMQQCGAEALPIVSLISLLVGLILAFVGSIQLQMFGAQIFVANLVGVGMVRALAGIMTGIIMAGRTGASFAAQLGTMQVNEEIDAFQTLGIPPMDFLVLPRMLGLFIMMPLLCLYANLMGVLGGMFVGVVVLDISPMQYINQTRDAISLNDLWVGLFSAAVFGILVALSGCLRGIQCGRSASAVGEATTSAVVTSIVSIIVATAVITVVTNILGI